MQNAKNHSRYVPLYHFVLYPLILLVLIGSVFVMWCTVYLFLSFREFLSTFDIWKAAIVVVISIILLIIAWFMRSFALKAQDRAIRAEENLRHFAFTGKLLDNKLTMSQIIALRFASDEEFVALAKQAAENNMKNKEIKKAIKVWKSDNNRV